MKYTPPLDSQDQDAGYVNADPANGTEGSKIPAAALENPQREIVGAISKAEIWSEKRWLAHRAAQSTTPQAFDELYRKLHKAQEQK